MYAGKVVAQVEAQENGEMEKEVALKLSGQMRSVLATLDDSIKLVQETCGKKEFEGYRGGVAEIMGGVCDVMNRLYAKFPDIMPDELK